MKYKAYQIAPEYQQVPDVMDTMDDTIAITGNRNYFGFTPEAFLQAQSALEYGENPTEDNAPEFDIWEKLIDEYSQQLRPNDETYCAALELLTGEKWSYTVLRGCAQCEWQGCYYVANMWTNDALEALETEYFNTGTEWKVANNDDDEIYIYCHGVTDESNRAEIADVIGADAGDITLYKFVGWTRTPEYTEV